MSKRIWLSASTAIIGLFVALWICRSLIVDWSRKPITLQEAVVMEFPRGTKLSALANQLESRGLISSATYFTLWVRFVQRNYPRFQAGTYRFDQEVAPENITAKFISGEVYVPVLAQITIPEAFTLKKTINRLAANGISTVEELTRIASDAKFIKKLKVSGSSLEGYIYPATYKFVQKMPSGEEALTQFVENFWEQLPQNYEQDVNRLGLTLQKAVIFASMIELETRFDDERQKIAEVIWRRLKSNQPLGIDAALIYGIEDYKGDITWKHLKDSSNPYNLRIHRGLPPSPIGSPSVESLKAVLSPSQFGYTYYVLSDDHSGRHVFTRSAAEHNKAVQRYLRSLRKSGH